MLYCYIRLTFESNSLSETSCHSEKKNELTFSENSFNLCFVGRSCKYFGGFWLDRSRVSSRTPLHSVDLKSGMLKTIFPRLFTESAIQNRYDYKFLMAEQY